jgi:hypothetical protein
MCVKALDDPWVVNFRVSKKIAQSNNAAQNGNVAPPAPATNAWTDFLKTVSTSLTSGRENTNLSAQTRTPNAKTGFIHGAEGGLWGYPEARPWRLGARSRHAGASSPSVNTVYNNQKRSNKSKGLQPLFNGVHQGHQSSERDLFKKIDNKPEDFGKLGKLKQLMRPHFGPGLGSRVP